MGVPARAVAQPSPHPHPDPDLQLIVELVTVVAAFNDRKFLREDARVFFEDRIRVLQRLQAMKDEK